MSSNQTLGTNFSKAQTTTQTKENVYYDTTEKTDPFKKIKNKKTPKPDSNYSKNKLPMNSKENSLTNDLNPIKPKGLFEKAGGSSVITTDKKILGVNGNL